MSDEAAKVDIEDVQMLLGRMMLDNLALRRENEQLRQHIAQTNGEVTNEEPVEVQ